MALSAVAFLLLFFIGLVLAFAVHPRFGLYTYLAVFYLHPPARWWGEMLPDFRWSLLAALVTLVALVRLPKIVGRPSFFSLTPVWLLIGFTLWVWVQNAWALEPVMHLDFSILLTKYVVLFYLMYRLIDSPRMMNDVLFIHVLGCFYLGWLAYQAADAGRLEGIGGPGIDEANAMAMHVATGVMAAAVLIMNPGRWWFRVLCLLAMPFMLNVVIQSESRSAVLAFVAGGLVLWFMKPRAYRGLFYAGAVLGLAAVMYLGHSTFWERMSTIESAVQTTEGADGSARSRRAIAEMQLKISAQHPFGIGHRGLVVLAPQYLPAEYLARQGSRSSHNTYLTVLSEQGLPGTLLFGGLMLWAVRQIWRMRDIRHRGDLIQFTGQVAAVAAMLGVAAVAGLGVDYLKAEVQLWALVLLAVLSVEYTRMSTVTDQAPAPVRPVASFPPTRWTG